MNNLYSWVAACLAALLLSTTARAEVPAVTVVLVHGALIDGSSWRGVYDELARDGYRIRVVQQPLTGFDDDVAATRRVLDQESEPIVLVGHSYGGAVISVAGNDAKVKALVYVAGLQPDKGETAGEAAPPQADSGKHLRVSKDGFLTLDPAFFAADFGADLAKPIGEFMAHSQRPIAAAAFNVRMPEVAWRTKPSYVVLGTQDRALSRENGLRMARRAASTVALVEASHALHITQPKAVAAVIERAAREVQDAGTQSPGSLPAKASGLNR
jgi:pimeloyl-ACP methyl ester carboxylesterase